MYEKFYDDEMPYKKRSSKKRPKKSNHKHNYEIAEIEVIVDGMKMHKMVCTICNKKFEKIIWGST